MTDQRIEMKVHGGGINPRVEALAKILCRIRGNAWPSDSGEKWRYRMEARQALLFRAALAELDRLETVEGIDPTPVPDDTPRGPLHPIAGGADE